MAEKASFGGFSKQTVSFFRGLAKNNDKRWFEAHREQYEEAVKGPSMDFVVAMGERLRAIAPGVVADPRVNRSLFRLNRDARFSHDKSPYKTHLGLWMWEGPGQRMENSGFYFQLEPKSLLLAAGMHVFPPELLKVYRDDVAHPVHGAALVDAMKRLARGGLAPGGEHFKRVPRGFDPEHPRADYLRFNALWTGVEMPLPAELYTPDLVEFCFGYYQKMLPLHQWLVALTERAL